jgi:hypothetical protein
MENTRSGVEKIGRTLSSSSRAMALRIGGELRPSQEEV